MHHPCIRAKGQNSSFYLYMDHYGSIQRSSMIHSEDGIHFIQPPTRHVGPPPNPGFGGIDIFVLARYLMSRNHSTQWFCLIIDSDENVAQLNDSNDIRNGVFELCSRSDKSTITHARLSSLRSGVRCVCWTLGSSPPRSTSAVSRRWFHCYGPPIYTAHS